MSFAKAGPSTSCCGGLPGASAKSDSEVLKENKLFWDGMAGRSAGLRNAMNTSARGSSGVPRTSAGKLLGSSGSTLYGKKETGPRKKGKAVLCDSKDQSIGNKKDTIPLLGLNPVKRLKVNQAFVKAESDDLSTNPSSDESRATTTTISDEPGCSKVLSKRPSGIPVFKRAPPSVSLAAVASSGINAISYAGPSTSKAGSSIVPTSNPKISLSSTAVAMQGIRKKVGTETGSGPMIKLKKKRSLKPDPPNIKRKKSRVKTVWH